MKSFWERWQWEKRDIVGLVAVLLVLVFAGAFLVTRGRAQAESKRRYFLTAEQNQALDKFDTALAELSKQFQDVKGKRDFLLTGIVVSNKDTAALGLEWSKTFKETTVDGKRCLEAKTVEEIEKEKTQ